MSRISKPQQSFLRHDHHVSVLQRNVLFKGPLLQDAADVHGHGLLAAVGGRPLDLDLAEIGKLLFGNGELLPTVLIGAGRLGTAVSSFISRDTNGYKLIAAFDINPALEGKEISGVTIRPLSELESFCAAHKPVVAVLCVPRQSAMDLSDELVRLGIQGFWNFSHYDLSVVYPQVTVENVHLGDSLMSLGYRLRNHDE